MRRVSWQGGRQVIGAVAISVAALGLGGCGDGAPPVSASTTEVTVKGIVKYKGKPVKEGTIRFDPANIQRRDAKAASAPIGADGSYTIKTLQGENTVGFILPDLAKKDFSLASESFVYDAPAGESTYDVDLGK